MDTKSDYDADSYLNNIKIRSNIIGIAVGILTSFVVIAIVISISVGFVVIYRENDIQSIKDNSTNVVLITASKLQNVITETFGCLEIFTEAMVHSNYNISDQYFVELAARWRARHPLINAFEYAYGTNMTLQLVDPYNPKTLGLQLDNLPQKPQKAANANTTIMYGPNTLVEGGIAFIGMDPIYYPNNTFFGVSIALIDLNVVLNSIEWQQNLEGYNYVFETGSTSLIFANNSPLIEGMISIEIEIIKESWLIRVIPINGWIARDMVWLEGIVITILSIMSMVLTIFVVRQIIVSIYQRHESKYLKDKLELEFRDKFKNFTIERIVVEKYMDTSNDILDLMNIVILKVRDGMIVDYSGDINKYFGIDEPRNMAVNKFIVNLLTKKTKIIHKNGSQTDCIVDQKMQDDISVIMIKIINREEVEIASTSTGKTPNKEEIESVSASIGKTPTLSNKNIF